MPGAELFRAAALEARRTEPLGGILLAQPLSFALLTAGAAVAAAALLAFFIWGTYTAHTTLAGQLVPEGGVIKVHAPQAGTVVAKHVVEGMPVARGDLLYVVSSERVSDALGATQEVIAAELR
jgi:membrane fusion protein